MKHRIAALAIALCIMAPAMVAGTDMGPAVGKAFATSETASVDEGDHSSFSYKTTKTTADQTDEQTSGGYKVVRRRNGTLDLSFAYNAVPKKTSVSKSSAKVKTPAADSSDEEVGIDDNKVNDDRSSNSSSQEDTPQVVKPEESTQSDSSQEQSGQTETSSQPSSAATQPAAQQTVKKQSPRCVKQIIRFNADVDADLDYDAISAAYEPTVHGKHLTRTVTATRPADENLADITDPNLQAQITNITK